jgi:3-dehydroquinate dehydratase / shikimate dehydrogenase
MSALPPWPRRRPAMERSGLPFHVVTLTHATWEEALACAPRLRDRAIPELRLDLFPELDPAEAVAALRGNCVVTCRRREEGGAWAGTEPERTALLLAAAQARPAWIDLEWDLDIPEALQPHLTHTRLIRSVHVAPGVFDIGHRLSNLPPGDAYKWVGHAARLADNALLRPHLAAARDRGLCLSAFLMGPKGIPSRCLQAAWGGSFTYAAPDDGPPAAPGQLALGTLEAWRCARLTRAYHLCGVLGSPVLHSRGPAFHNARFQRAFKDLLYLPLDCGDAEEARSALEALEILGASLTMPLKESLPALLGLEGPLNTLWRRGTQDPWQAANTDLEALQGALAGLPEGPVLLLGDGGVARTSLAALSTAGRPLLQACRARPVTEAEVAALAPVGVIQATSLGMTPGDPLPFPALLEAARPSLRWAVEWIYKEETAFAAWAEGLTLVGGTNLFEAQAQAQSRRFVEECG